MRDNGKVTQKEYMLPEDITIVSKTDLHGNITSANEAFIEASGYAWTELVGQPHNILRHPDVPPAVFKDFWSTIQKGKPWSQIVKNRRKNGDHYWVVANATPIFENGNITGYMSVRTPASREQVSLAEQAYRDIDSGKLAIENGIPAKLTDRLNPLLQLNQTTIALVLSVLLLTSAFTPLIVPGITKTIPELVFEITDITLVALIILSTWLNGQRLKEITRTITSISEGNFANEIDNRGHNLVSTIFSRLKSMQIKLGSDLDDVKYALASSQRVESALKSASSNIMVADRFRSIIFMNDSIQEMLKKIEPELKKTLPNFDSENLMRQSIDIFHQHPEHQAKMLDNLTSTHNARIKIGRITIDLIIDPIFDDQGQRIGTVAEWKNMTEQLAIEDNIANIIADAAQGTLSNRIDTSELTGFENQVSTSINSLLNTFSDITQKLNLVLSQMAEGNLTAKLEGNYQNELLAMQASTNNALNNLGMTLSQISTGANQIGNMAEEVSIASEDLSQRTQEQAASLEETAASMEELTATLENSSNNAEQANNIVHGTADRATNGIAVMNKTLNAMSDITDVSKQIGEITSVIDSIAFQTNLLALNAAVEAARAGEHGRGFAVVAGEVRNLAGKSAEAAKDISSLITSAIEQITGGTELVEETNKVFEEMVNSIQEVEGLIKEVASTTDEQTKGIKQVNIAVRQLDEVTQNNAALVEELSATAGNMSAEAQTQSDFVNRFEFSDQPVNQMMTIDFADAKLKHNAWNAKLEQYLAGQETDINSENARKSDACPLGKWIYSGGQSFMQYPEMQMLERLHSEFHATIGQVIDAKELNDMESAQQKKQQVYQLSQEILSIIDRLNETVQSASKAANSSPKSNSQATSAAIAPSAPTENKSQSCPVSSGQLDSSAEPANPDEWQDF